MENFIGSCIGKYMDFSGVRELKHVSTPFLPEVQETPPSGTPPRMPARWWSARGVVTHSRLPSTR
eukprot:130384-Lingulodinium_polyedra.AAC.1